MSTPSNDMMHWRDLVNQALNTRRLFQLSDNPPESVNELRKIGPRTVQTIIYGVAQYLGNSPSEPTDGYNYSAIAALCQLLGEFRDPAALPLLKGLAIYQSNIYEYRELRPSVIRALGQLGDLSILPTLKELRNRRDLENISQIAVLDALAALGEPIEDARALLVRLGHIYDISSRVDESLSFIQLLEPRLNQLNRDERGTFWFFRAYIAKNFQPENTHLREYCLRSLAEFLERDLLWEWLGIKGREFHTPGTLIDLIEKTPGLEELARQLGGGVHELHGFKTTLFLFFTNSAVNKQVPRRASAEEWAQQARDWAQTPDADVIFFEYNEWDCPRLQAIEQSEFDRIHDDLVRGISKVLGTYGIVPEVAERLCREMHAYPNPVSQRMMIVVKHTDYAVNQSRILQAIHELSRTEETINGWGMSAWQPLSRRGRKLRSKSVTLKSKINFSEPITSLAMIPEGQVAMIGFESGTIMMYDYAVGRPWGLYVGHIGAVTSIAISRDSRFALAGGIDETIQFWAIDTAHQYALDPEIYNQMGDNMMIFSTDNSDLPNARPSKMVMHDHKGKVNSVDISPDGQWGLSGSDDRTMRLWDLSSGRCLREFKGHSGAVNAVAFSPDGRLAISGSEDHSIRLWDLATGRSNISLQGHQFGVRSFAILEFQLGGVLLSGDADGKILTWNLRTGQRISTLMEKAGGTQSIHAGEVHSITSFPTIIRDGQLIGERFSGGKDTMLVGADIQSGNTFLREPHDGFVNGVAISPDGHFLLSGSGDKFMRLWTLEWEYEFPPMSDWDEAARPYLENFLALHTPYQGSIKEQKAPSSRELEQAFTRRGLSTWTNDDFAGLLLKLGLAGMGWLRSEGIHAQLEKMVNEI